MKNRSDSNLSKDRPEAKFGHMMGSVLSCLGLWQLLGHGRPIGGMFVALGALFLLLALVVPGSLGPVYRYWMQLGHALGWVNTRIILTLLYVLLFVPIGLILRIFGKDLMDQRIRADQQSYWVRKPAIADPSRYEKQY